MSHSPDAEISRKSAGYGGLIFSAVLQAIWMLGIIVRMANRILHCPKCQTSESVNFDTLNFQFINYRKTGSIREYQCPKCGFFIPGRNALNAATMAEAIDRQRQFEELLKS